MEINVSFISVKPVSYKITYSEDAELEHFVGKVCLSLEKPFFKVADLDELGSVGYTLDNVDLTVSKFEEPTDIRKSLTMLIDIQTPLVKQVLESYAKGL